jgi:hypothetical protein
MMHEPDDRSDLERAHPGETRVGPLPVKDFGIVGRDMLPQYRIAQGGYSEFCKAIQILHPPVVTGGPCLIAVTRSDAIDRALMPTPKVGHAILVWTGGYLRR